MTDSKNGLEDALAALEEAKRSMASAIDEAKDALKSMASAHEEALEERDEEISRLKAAEDEELTAATDAAHKVCDAVDRPVGKLTFIIPRPDEFDRAMISLHDAIGRNI